jgi:hypothetical protein
VLGSANSRTVLTSPNGAARYVTNGLPIVSRHELGAEIVKYLTPYKIAAYLLAFFFTGHTFGGMLGQKSMGPASDTVFEAMKSVHFDFNGADSTWYGFWFGFGLYASVFLLFSIVVAWQLDQVERASWPAVSTMAWAFVATHAAGTVLCWAYFFAGPGVCSTLVTGLLAAGALRKQRATV